MDDDCSSWASAASHDLPNLGFSSEKTASSSRCVTQSFTATHDFEVTDFSLLNGMGIGSFVTSCVFTVGGCHWTIHLYPDGSWPADDDDDGGSYYVSASLYFRGGAAPETGVRAKFTLGLVDRDGRVSRLPCGGVDCTSTCTFGYAAENRECGFDRFIEKFKLRHFLYLNDDCFTIRCLLTVVRASWSEGVSTIVIPPASLHRDLSHMLREGKGVDVTFDVDGELFHAHKHILAARSPVFDAELFGPLKKDRIKIDDMEPAIFEALLHFIYTDSLMNCSCSGGADENATMQHLLVAADRYGLDRLRVMCEAQLWRGLDVETVATTLALSEQHNCAQLKDACLGFIASRSVLGAVIKTDGFRHLEESCPSIAREILGKIATVEGVSCIPPLEDF